MKKSLVIGAATLAITAMVGTGFGMASSQDVKEESTLAAKTTASVKATAEEIAAFEAESVPATKTTPARKATAEEIAAFEKELKEATPATESTEATKK